jgi:hypothetical protein
MLDIAWHTFAAGSREVSALLSAAQKAPVLPTGGRVVSEQQTCVRASIVLLAAHLEGFFRALPEEFADDIGDTWDRETPGVKRYVALHAIRRLTLAIREAKGNGCKDSASVENVRRSVIGTSRWFKRPDQLSSSGFRSRLRGFYRQRGARAVEGLLRDFHPEATPYFKWIAAKGFDRSRFWTVLEGLIQARNEIAHGNATMSLTLGDARQYLAVCVVLVRQVRTYVS